MDKHDPTTDKRETDINGFIEVLDNPVLMEGIYPYISPPGAPLPDTVYMVFRGEEELSKPETLESLRLMPIVDLHPTAPEMLGDSDNAIKPEQHGIHGTVGERITFDANGKQGAGIYANLKLISSEIRDKIDNQGIKELSPGYWARYDYTPGEYNGIKYDAIQRDIKFNHLALVPDGRQGSVVSVLDQMENPIFNQPPNEVKTMQHSPEKLQKLAELLANFFAEEATEGTADAEEKEGEKEATKDSDCDDDKEATKDSDDDDNKDDEKKGTTDAAIAEIVQKQLKRVAVKDALYEQVKPLIGVIDHADFTPDELAAYTLKKIGVTAEKGSELAFLKGYLSAKPVSSATIDHVETHSQGSKLTLGDFK